MLKKGDYIYCHDAEDMKQTLHDLGEDVNAVVWDPVRFILKVNRVKGEEDGENETMPVLRK